MYASDLQPPVSGGLDLAQTIAKDRIVFGARKKRCAADYYRVG
jgi:hypothetical protein